MSLSFYSITCSGCTLDLIYRPHDGHTYRYLLPDQSEIPANTGDGWCMKCERAIRIQSAMIPDNLDERRRHLEREIAPAQAARNRWRLFRRRPSFEEMARCEYAHSELTQILALQQIVGDRIVPARCLVCGSNHVVEFQLPEFAWESRFPMPFFHPKCGGQLMIAETGRWPASPAQPKYIDPHEHIR